MSDNFKEFYNSVPHAAWAAAGEIAAYYEGQPAAFPAALRIAAGDYLGEFMQWWNALEPPHRSWQKIDFIDTHRTCAWFLPWLFTKYPETAARFERPVKNA